MLDNYVSMVYNIDRIKVRKNLKTGKENNMGKKEKITVDEDEFCFIAATAIKETANMVCGLERKIYISMSALTIEKMWDMLVEYQRLEETK